MDHSDRLRSPRFRGAAASVRKLLLVVAAVGVVLVPASPALAHNQLVSAKPDRNATLRKAPTEIRLAFLQRLDPKFTTVVVSDADKRPLPSAKPTVKAKTAQLKLDQPPENGKYTVAYRVVSVDGHTVDGSYTFTVAGPAPASAAAPSAVASADGPAAAPSAAATTLAAVPASDDSAMSNGLLAGLGAVVLVLAAVVIFLYVSRRRRTAARP